MVRTRVERAGTAVLVAVGFALMVTGIGGATNSELPRGWWKGTIVLKQDWNRTGGYNSAIRGSATLRIERTGPKTANYELAYTEETRGAAGPGLCPDQLESTTTSSLKTTAPIGVRVTDTASGALFRITAGVKARLTTTFAQCETNSTGVTTQTTDLNLAGFSFVSKEPDSATIRRGSGLLESGNEFFPGTKTTASWDLKLVKLAEPRQEPSGTKPTVLAKPAIDGFSTTGRTPETLFIGVPFASLEPTVTIRCAGRLDGSGPRVKVRTFGVSPSPVTDYLVRKFPELARHRGERVALANCIFGVGSLDAAAAACGKTLRGTFDVRDGGKALITVPFAIEWRSPIPWKRACRRAAR